MAVGTCGDLEPRRVLPKFCTKIRQAGPKNDMNDKNKPIFSSLVPIRFQIQYGMETMELRKSNDSRVGRRFFRFNFGGTLDKLPYLMSIIGVGVD